MSDAIPSEEVQRSLVLRYQSGDNSAGAAMLKIHNGAIYASAKRYAKLADFEDLLQEARMGLLVGLKKYDPTSDTKVIAYVSHWIRAAAGRFAANLGGEIRVPVYAQAKARRTDESESLYRFRRPTSLDAPILNTEGMTVGDTIAAPELEDTSEDERRDARAHELLSGLTPREREVVERRLMADAPERLADIGARWGVPGKIVRRIESDAIHKLQGVPGAVRVAVPSTKAPKAKRRTRATRGERRLPIRAVQPMHYDDRYRSDPNGYPSAIVCGVLFYMGI